MYNILIVDDEPTIREGLKIIIPWEDYHFKVIGSASNGNDALEQYQHFQETIHVMFVDIKMPGMDGLTFIKNIKNINPNILFVMISGYADFNYAKRAMAYGVEDYILKPIDEEDLLNSLLKLQKKLMKMEDHQELLNKSGERGVEEFIVKVIMQSINLSDYQLIENTQKLKLSWSLYQIILINVQQKNDNQIPVKQKLLEMNREQSRGHVFSYATTTGVLLNKALPKNQNLEYLYNDLKNTLQIEEDFILSVGTVVNHISEIRDSYKVALKQLYDKFFYRSNIITPNTKKILLCKVGEKDILSEKDLIYQLLYAIEIGKVDVIDHILEGIFWYVKGDESETSIKRNFIHLVSMIYNELIKKENNLSLINDIFSKWLVEIYHQPHYEALISHIKMIFRKMIDQMGINSNDVIIKKLFDLIETNYSKNLKLETLAGVFNYSSAYLGKLFKNTTGENFHTYLDRVRVKRAKELLLEGHKVYEVANLVGYTNVDYFYSKFKKYMGTSPSTYKKKHK